MNSKMLRLSVRVTEDEKNILAKSAESHSMSLSEYTRYKLLSGEIGEEEKASEYSKNSEREDIEMRLMVSTYIITYYLKTKTFDEDTIAEIDNAIRKKYKELGIEKKS